MRCGLWKHGAGVSALVWMIGIALPVAAVPPGAMVGPSMTSEHWIQHLVIPGERLKEIGERYAVSVSALISWNKLDPDRPRLRAGSRLRVKTPLDLPQRRRRVYRVRKGDTWSGIAHRHGVKTSHVRERWNRGVQDLIAGDRIILWVEEEPDAKTTRRTARKPEALHAAVVRREIDEPIARDDSADDHTGGADEVDPEMVPDGPDDVGQPSEIAGLPIVAVPPTSRSIGRPGRGRIRKSLRLPNNPALYTVRSPAHAHATSHTIIQLQTAIAKFRAATGFARELTILDISRKNGGRLRPHRSHRSGRDVDIRLPLAPGVPDGTVPFKAEEVDWDMTWALVRQLIDTDQVVYIFLTRSRQRRLYEAAQRAGTSEEDLLLHIQYPGTARKQTVRHAPGHEKHIHVRFKCAPDSARCRD